MHKQVGRKVTPQKGREPIANLFSRIVILAVSDFENKSDKLKYMYVEPVVLPSFKLILLSL